MSTICLNLFSLSLSLSLSFHSDPSPIQNTHTREVSLALKQLGCTLEGEDNMLETICSEVKCRGTLKAITSEIIEADKNDTTDYVIRRPRKAMATRDYLNDKDR